MSERPVCLCHGAEMYWHKKKDMLAGGLWRCTVRKREAAKRHSQTDGRKQSLSRYWHRPDGGYVKRRRHQLAVQRGRILEQLSQLEQEAVTLVSQP